ncbi:MAG: HlyD family efflux transporter periplasmic adaptor subunit [Xanthomonadales bacterium]|nr:efflux RND transporter periplasmic adaptor subunit [Gammaproteobacteria bacterium]NND55788.1 HlyD family efflux transporter periplasmic adaptor subunit [Xanthomonadales bacterium]NNK50052.1 HlyD family efflux transporter periplasmic adaptor subunit [Xanthomonadales bacterium]
MDRDRTDVKARKQRRKKVLGVSGALAVVIIAAFVFTLEPAAPSVDRDTVWLGKVEQGELIRQVRGPGTLVPKEERWIAATTDALVEHVRIKPGAVVQPDTIILEMSNPELVQIRQEAELELEAAEADHLALKVSLINRRFDGEARLAEIKAQYLGAKLQVQAEVDLFKQNIISRLDYERSKLAEEQLGTRYDIEQRRVVQVEESIEAELAASEARLERLRNILVLREAQSGALTVRAGIEGILQEVLPEPGQRVATGATLARVARIDSLLAELRIPEVQAKDLLLSQEAEIDTRNGKARGRVVRIDPSVVNGAVIVDVEFIDGLPDGARPDLSVSGTIEIDRIEDTVFMGRPVFGQAESFTSIFRLNEEGNSATRVQVKLGLGSVNTIEVLEGLAPGEQVILSDMSKWDKSDRIKLN